MTSRILPREDYGRLVGTELEQVAPLLPEGSRVVVVEAEGEIVACWALFSMVHLEGCWIAPAQRGNAGVVRRLLAGMTRAARDMGAATVWTSATDPDVADLAARLGAVEIAPSARHFSLRLSK
jgi:N-acetylglutamate synthase-like GNAT family acetyltransferase